MCVYKRESDIESHDIIIGLTVVKPIISRDIVPKLFEGWWSEWWCGVVMVGWLMSSVRMG